MQPSWTGCQYFSGIDGGGDGDGYAGDGDDSLCGLLGGGQELSLGGGIGPSIAVATVIRGIGGGGVDICLYQSNPPPLLTRLIL